MSAYAMGATSPQPRTGVGGEPDLPPVARVRNAARRRALTIVHNAWARATDLDVSSRLYRVMDYLMTPEGMVQYSATARWHRGGWE